MTFGCLNRLYKISDEAIALWARILETVPGSSLLLKYRGLESPAVRARFVGSFADHGVGADRLVLLGGTTQREHLETYNRIDITLDTLPHGGGITTMESLWMGTPVLGLYDSLKSATRLAKVLCEPLGLADWVALSPDGYCRLARHWAGRRDDIADLRLSLRRRVAEVYSRFPADVETAYRIMWRRWCANETPTAIDLGTETAKVPEPA